MRMVREVLVTEFRGYNSWQVNIFRWLDETESVILLPPGKTDEIEQQEIPVTRLSDASDILVAIKLKSPRFCPADSHTPKEGDVDIALNLCLPAVYCPVKYGDEVIFLIRLAAEEITPEYLPAIVLLIHALNGKAAEWVISSSALQSNFKQSDFELRIQELADLSPLTLLVLDLDGSIIYVNPADMGIIGYSPEDFKQGLNYRQIIIPDDFAQAEQHFIELLKGNIVKGKRYTFIWKTVNIFPLKFT